MPEVTEGRISIISPLGGICRFLGRGVEVGEEAGGGEGKDKVTSVTVTLCFGVLWTDPAHQAGLSPRRRLPGSCKTESAPG